MSAYTQIVTVIDNETHEPLDLVTFSSESPKAFTMTNGKGQADLASFAASEKIEVRLLGYKTETVSFADLQELGFELKLQRTYINLDQIVVSATKRHQSSTKIPAKISTVSAKEVAFQQPQTAADLLGVSGKVYIQKSQQGGGSPMIRGFATNRLLYAVDGVRMNSAIFRAGNLQNVINLDPFATENTEVVFGPGSVIYGSDAIGGVMSFQTLTPQLSYTDQPFVKGKVVSRFSSANNEKTAHFDANVGWKKWAMVTSISYWDFDHLKQGSHGPDDYIKPIYVQRIDSIDRILNQEDPLLQIPSAYSQMNMMQKIRFRPNDKWDFQYAFHYSETSPYGRYDRNNRMRNGTLRYAEWFYGPQKWMMNNFSLTNTQLTLLYDEMILRLAQQSFEESRMDRALNNKKRRVNTENVEAYSVNLDLTKSLGKQHKLYYGAEFIYDDVVSKGTETNMTTAIEELSASRYPKSDWSSLAVYVNDEVTVSNTFTALAGLRYNQFIINADFSPNIDFYPFPFTEASINNGALTGSIGGVYRPNQEWVLSANFGTAFRSPNVDDIGKVFDSEAGGVTVPNPDLKAEYAYNFDIGVAKKFGERVKIDLAAYYTILDHAMVKRDYHLGGLDSIVYDGQMSRVQAIQNAASAYVYGIQAGLEIELPAGFSIMSDLNYQYGIEELDDGSTSRSRHAPPMFGITRLQYKTNKLRMQLYSMYMAERTHEDLPFGEKTKDELYTKDADGNTWAPAWNTLNFKAEYLLSQTFTISSGIENLTDKRYRPYSSGISAPGRNFVFSVRANF
ncbi:MAG: TonB-dependent receptor [Bacteroidales bacterium]|nr:TonB-dependent receptor [Bacteroidales bacterium]MDD3702311.1 TonB-dependent receptor [Bacteroidales bacterium]MDY0370314.1 TonB-dependent receptor [Bacteroidales bacterium]